MPKLYNLLPELYRIADESNDYVLRELLDACEVELDGLIEDLENWVSLWIAEKCPENIIDHLLRGLGNPFRFELSLAQKRKLVSLLVHIYKVKGTRAGIIDVIRLFQNLQIIMEEPWCENHWQVDMFDLLEDDTYMAPDPQDDPHWVYHFFVISSTELEQEQVDTMWNLINYMKPAHTHFSIILPTEVTVYDHWELDISALDDETFVHA